MFFAGNRVSYTLTVSGHWRVYSRVFMLSPDSHRSEREGTAGRKIGFGEDGKKEEPDDPKKTVAASANAQGVDRQRACSTSRSILIDSLCLSPSFTIHGSLSAASQLPLLNKPPIRLE